MFKKTQLGVVVVAALCLLALSSTTAIAASVSIEPAGPITAVSLGLLSFLSELGTITCRVTMAGSLHRLLIEKTVGALIGLITRVSTACNESLVLRTELNLPWHIQFRSIEGTLPSGVTAIGLEIERVSFLMRIPTMFGNPECLYRGSLPGNMGVAGTNPYTSGLISVLNNSILLLSEALNGSIISCPSGWELFGSFSLSPTQRIRRL